MRCFLHRFTLDGKWMPEIEREIREMLASSRSSNSQGVKTGGQEDERDDTANEVDSVCMPGVSKAATAAAVWECAVRRPRAKHAEPGAGGGGAGRTWGARNEGPELSDPDSDEQEEEEEEEEGSGESNNGE